MAHTHNIILAILTAAAQFVQSWMLTRTQKKSGAPQDPSAALSRNLVYLFPLLTGYFAYTFPSGLALYWLASTVFAIIQQLIIMRTGAKPTPTHQDEPVVVR